MWTSIRVSCLAAMIASSAFAVTLPADIAVYGEQPATFRNDVTPFPARSSRSSRTPTIP